MGDVLLIRHGQASFGAADYDALSPLGQQQAARLGQWLRESGQNITQVVLGSMRRHRQTTEACMENFGVPEDRDWYVDAGFDEYDHEDMIVVMRPEFRDPGALARALESEPNPRRAFQHIFIQAFQRWTSGDHDEEYKESWPGFRARCEAALDRTLTRAGSGQRIAVFTSGGVISVISAGLLHMPDHRVGDLNSAIVNSSVTRLLYQPGKLSLSTLNCHDHLYGECGNSLISYR